MKKLLLITLMIAILTCAFALVVNAEENANGVPEWPTEVTVLPGMSDKSVFGADGTASATSRVLMSDGKAYPAYYIFKNYDYISISLDEINKKDVNYSKSDIVRIEVPNGIVTAGKTCITKDGGFTAVKTITLPNTVTTIGAGAFKLPTLISINLPDTITLMENNVFATCTSLKSIKIPASLTSISDTVFNGCTALETVDFSNATSLKSIGYQAFYGTTSLEKAILPEGLTTLSNIAFKGSGVKEVYLPSTLVFENVGTNNVFGECSRLETIRSKSTFIAATMFYNAGALKNLYLEDTVTIGASAFYKAASLTSLTLPNTLTQIDTNAFAYASFDKIIVPASVTTLGDGTFKQNTSLKTAVVLGTTIGSNMFNACSNMTKLVITENFTTFGSSAINNVSKESFTTFYTGSTNDFDTIKTIITLDRVSSAKPSSYEAYKKGEHTQNKYIFLYGANICEVAYDNVHDIQAEEGNNCCGICSRCNLLSLYQNPTHTEELKLAFGTGVYDEETEKENKTTDVNYYANLYVLHVCVYCKNETTEADNQGPIFGKIGYSAAEYDTTSISYFTSVNHKTLALYEEMADTELMYGLVISAAPSVSPITGVDDEGKLTLAGSTVTVSMTDTEYTKYSVKVTGIPASQAINCCGYVVEANVVTYLGHNKVSDEAEIITHADALAYQNK